MNTKQLRYFLATAELGSITAAARDLDVAQPAVSLQIANLEHELKIKLFNRDFRGVELTNAGTSFVEHARIILGSMEAAKAELLGSKDKCEGKVTVGLSQSCCNVLSLQMLSELEHRFPHVELSFKVGQSMDVESWLVDDKIDIALSYDTPVHTNSKRSIPLIKEDLYLYISVHPKNPAYSELALFGSIAFSDLQHYDMFLPSKQDALHRLLCEQARKSNITLKPKAAFGQLMTTLHYVTQGYGLVVLPSAGAFHLEKSNQVRALNIFDPSPQRDVFLQTSDAKAKNNAVNAVYELIREITANVYEQEYWRGTLLDDKYAKPERTEFGELKSASS